MVPPRASEEEAEASGWIDNATGVPNAANYTLLASLDHGAKAGVVFTPAYTQAYLPDPAATGVAIAGIPGLTGSALVFGPPTKPIVSVVDGVVLVSARWRKASYGSVDVAGGHVPPSPITIRLAPPAGNPSQAWDVNQAAAGTPAWDPKTGTLTIFVAPGRFVDLQVSS